MTTTPHAPDLAASPTDPRGEHYVVTGLAPTPEQLAVVGHRQLNPDTNLALPSPSRRQQQLAAELVDRLGQHLIDNPGQRPAALLDTVTELLTEAVVRQHGRTVRAVRADLAATADSFDRDARAALAQATPSDAPVDLSSVRAAEQLATAGAALRTAFVRAAQA